MLVTHLLNGGIGMIEAYSENVDLVSGDNIKFNNTPVRTLSTQLSTDGTKINLPITGIYEVTFTTSFTTTGTLSAPEIGTFNLIVNGNESNRAVAQQLIGTGGAYSVGFTTLVKVVPAPIGNLVTIAVSYNGPAINATTADIVVTKVA